MAALVEAASGRRHELKDRTAIGRDPANDICLSDGMVSPRHAEVTRGVDGRYLIVDLGSRHGLYVGTRRVADATLSDGDELLVGPIRLRFVDRPAVDPVDDELARLRAIVDLTRAIGVEHDLERLLERILETAFQLLRADRGAIVLHSAGDPRPVLLVARTRSGEMVDAVLSTSLVSEVMARKAGLITSQADVDSHFNRSDSITGQGIRSVMVVPLVHQGDILGVIHLDSLASANVFAPPDLEIFTGIASQAAMSVKNALLVRQVQAVMTEEKKRLERVLERLPVGVVLLDAERRIELCNAWAQERLPDLSAALRDGLLVRPGTVELDLGPGANAQPDGSGGAPRRVYTVSSTASSDGTETVVVIHDVTEEREREQRSAHKERLALIGQLAGGVAHDFNNLLLIILNCAELVERSVVDSSVREDLGLIRQAAERAKELTRQLLAFARREVVKPRVVALPDLVESMEKMLAPMLGAHVRLRTLLARDMSPVLIDPVKLEQVVMNLVLNARDAMPGGGELSIETRAVELDEAAARAEGLPSGRYALLRVADTGVGMSPEVAARVFEPFFTTKEQGKGTGLGLATAYGVVTQAGGALSVRSKRGAGSAFSVYLPETTMRSEADPGPTAAEAAGGRETILLAEDEPAVRRLTKRLLVAAGYSVIDAESGTAALAAAEGRSIDLLLTDLVMPGMSGRELSRRLLQRRPGLPVVYMSGYVRDDVALDAGSRTWFLSKPFTVDELYARIREALAARAPRADRG